MCVAFESVAVAAQRRGGGASWKEALVLSRGVHATFALIKGLGYDIYPTSKKLIDGSPVAVLAATLWSLSRVAGFRDVLATGKAECDALVDVLTAAASRSNRPVDVARIAAMKP